jgi:serine phosphatase RsbU (regulator of sigma subunit)
MLRRYSALLLFCFLAIQMAGADSLRVIRISKHPGETFDLRRNAWLYISGDKPEYSGLNYNDSSWKKVSTQLYEPTWKPLNFKGHCWFRLHFFVDSLYDLTPMALSIFQKGASKVFLNGELRKEIGEFGKEDDGRDNGNNDPFMFVPVPGKENVIAIRYENTEYDHSFDNSSGIRQAGFESLLYTADEYWFNREGNWVLAGVVGLGVFVFLFSIGVVHFLLYIFYRARESNLHFSLFCFLFSYYFIHYYLSECLFNDPVVINIMTAILVLSTPYFFLSLLNVLYSLFYDKRPKIWKILLWSSMVASILLMVMPAIGFVLGALLVVVITVELIRVIIVSIRKKRKGALIISAGFGMMVLFISYAIICIFLGNFFGMEVELSDETPEGRIFFALLLSAIAAIPLSMSTFLAWDFSQTNKALSKKLIEVEQLSARALEQEKEKQKILSEQNEVLEHQVEERTKEINEQKKVIEEKNKDITDSINYAQRIQRSILPTVDEIFNLFKDNFVLFKPRDIVSGDFYQFKRKDDARYAILADCTGHGVPGALMSMIGSNLLNQIIMERGIKEPNTILSELHREVRSTLRQTGGVQSHDGMDASIVMYDGKKLKIASANRPVYIVNKGELTELKPDKRSIGGSSVGDDVTFTVNELNAEAGMMVYLFSDGYADQFGGEQGKKFKVKNLTELLVSISAKSLETQKEILNTTFDNWKKHLEQVDDVSLIGLKF